MTHLQRALQAIATRLARSPARARWSFADQILISGSNVVVTILLVRALGLEGFGVYSMIVIGVQFLAGVQSAAIVAPLMSLFDQRDRSAVSTGAYLAALLIHEAGYAAVVVVVIALVARFGGALFTSPIPIDFVLVAAVVVASQLQDLSRRFFYVTERPSLAFMSDVLAYGFRLVLIAWLALTGALTIDAVWLVMIATSLAGLSLLAGDGLDFSWPSIKKVTEAHMRIAGWMVGNNLVGWFSETGFTFFLIGAVLGPAQLGGVRAVLNLIHVVNLLLQSLENFVPSAASRALVEGGGRALIQYITEVALIGAGAIAAGIVLFMIFADPIMLLVYGQTFPDQLPVAALLGAYHVLLHVTIVTNAGLRATESMRAAFYTQVIVGAVSVVLCWSFVHLWGAVGALSALLLARCMLTGQMTLLLHRKARGISPRVNGPRSR